MQQAPSTFLSRARTLAAAALLAAVGARSAWAIAPAAAPRPANGGADAESLERAFVDISDRVGPAVVSVAASYTVVQRYSPWGEEFPDEILRQWFNAPYEQKQDVMSLGSGVIVSTDGYLLTNAHVVGQAKNVKVKLLSGKEYKARIVGKDEDTDLCVLKIDAEGPVTAAPLGDSEKIHVGQWAIAIGNPFALENTMTVGVISAKGRMLDEANGGRTARYTSFIQTDASINKGNSGGPLINIKGEVIGINSMIFSSNGGSIGLGFAIPINVAKNVMEGLIKNGHISRPQLGIAYRTVSPDVARKLRLPPGGGMEISSVLKDSAAAKAGLKPGDVILSVDKKPLKDANELRAMIQQRRVGDSITLDVYRKGQKLTIPVALKEESRSQEREAGEKRGETPEAGESSWLGMTVTALTDELAQHLDARDAEGVVVMSVAQDSVALTSGVQRGDIIREIEQQPVTSLKDFEAAKARIGDKDGVLLLIERQGSTMYLVVQREAGDKP